MGNKMPFGYILLENDMTDENFWSYVTPANIKACIAYLESVSAEE